MCYANNTACGIFVIGLILNSILFNKGMHISVGRCNVVGSETVRAPWSGNRMQVHERFSVTVQTAPVTHLELC